MAVTDHSGADRWGPDQAINRQLHDLVVPQLFVLSTGLAALQRREVEPANQALVHDLAEVAAQALLDLRSISRGQAVHEGGALTRVATRLRVATETVSRLTDCEVAFEASGDAVIPAPLEDDLVAVTWESVANAIRHGGASTVTVDLRAEPGTLSLVVTDDGRWVAAADSASSGLGGLYDRAAAWQGRAVIDHGDGATKVVWRIPLDATGRPLTEG
ncbi:MAG: ATP-binding protein [Actinomycetota bacterium]